MAHMQTHQLMPHPAFPPVAVTKIEARLHIVGNWLQLRWRIEGSGKVILPAFTGSQRRDELWRTTCFELFARQEAQQSYCEINLSLSEAWAAYDFTDRRKGMAERAVKREPVITPRQGSGLLIFDAALPLGDLPPLPLAYAMNCVIEEDGGRLSYWAMAHGAGAPDFHDPACFAATLAAPEGP